MADLLIPNIPDDVVAAIDLRAERLGISRSDLLRRIVVRAGGRMSEKVTADSLERFSDLFTGLTDPHVMDQAWN